MPLTVSPESNPIPLYPVFLDLSGKTVLVVGGGHVATRKLQRLTEHTCHIVVLSPACSDETKTLIEAAPSIFWLKRWYSFEALEEAQPHVVFACTNDENTNQSIVEHCKRLGIIVNSATHGHWPGDAIIPSQSHLANNQLQIALSTGSNSPILTRYFRKQIEKTFDTPATARLLKLFKTLRLQLKEAIPEQETRQQMLESILSNPELQTRIEAADFSEEALLDWARHLVK